jgi:hypothetical protein
MKFYDSLKDPLTNGIIDKYCFQSNSATGASTMLFDDLIIPTSPNFPFSTNIRYMLYLPGEPDYFNIVKGNSTFIVKNINSTIELSRIAPNMALSPYTYKIFPNTVDNCYLMEIHVGINSNKIGDIISFEGNFVGSILHPENLENLRERIINIKKETFTINNYFSAFTASNDIASGNNVMVGVGTSNNIYYSTDFGNTWTIKTTTAFSTFTNSIEKVLYTTNFFIAVELNYYCISTDGKNWSTANTLTSNDFRGVGYGNDYYFLLCDDGAIYRSSNASTWLLVHTSNDNYVTMRDIIYGKDVFVCCGSNVTSSDRTSIIFTSLTGTTWANRAVGSSAVLYSITYGNGYFITVGSTGSIFLSSTGSTWTLIISGTTNDLMDIIYVDDYKTYYVVGKSNTLLSSTSGSTWKNITFNTTYISDLYGICYNQGQFMIACNNNLLIEGGISFKKI